MKRLTKRGTRKNGYVSAIGSGFGCWGQIVDRLAAYEDTGLEPKEVKKIYGLLAEIAEDRNCHFDFVTQCVLKVGRELKEGNAPLTLEELREMDG